MIQTCDKRRSRAARSILINATLPILEQHDLEYADFHARKKKKKQKNKIDSFSLSQSERMELYKTLLSKVITSIDDTSLSSSSSSDSSTSNSRKCILHPDHDILWKEEQSYMTIKGRNNKRLTLHKNGTSGKTFRSRYYLDLHMMKKYREQDVEDGNGHTNENEDEEVGLSLCPADEWCNLLGGNLCDRIALQDEPYYAPGLHDEKDGKSQQIALEFKRQIHSHPCNETELQLSQDYCMQVMNDCFGADDEGNKYDSLRNEMVHTLCHTQTCRHRMIPLHWLISHHDLRREWDMHHDDMHHVGILCYIIVLCLIVYGISQFHADIGVGVMPIYRLWTRLTGQHRKTQFDLTKRKKLD